MPSPFKKTAIDTEQRLVDGWRVWAQSELPRRRISADRAYKRALAEGDEAAWQHAEIIERAHAQLVDMLDNQDPYFARIRGVMEDVNGEQFQVDLRVHRYHRSETFFDQTGEEVLDISHLAPLADLVRNPQTRELVVTVNDRELLQRHGNHPRILVEDSAVEDIEIENGRVLRVAPRYGAIFEDRVRRRLAQSAAPALDVLADVLDPEQNQIVGDRSPHIALMVLDGPAGTGKTVVAAHRVAVAEAPDSPGLYLTPSSTLRDYIQPVLPRLGLARQRARVQSLVDLVQLMWPDLPWSPTLSESVCESRWDADAWRVAFDRTARDRQSPEDHYRTAAASLGKRVGNTLGVDDIVPLLWMGALSGRARPTPHPRWIIIDEAQAFPLLAYQALSRWLGAGVHWIVAGDLMQQGSESNWNGWDQIAQALGVRAKNTRSVWLSKSYRVPPKIHVAAEALRQAVYPQSLPSQSVSWHPHSGRVAVAIVPSLQDQAGRVLEWIEELHHAQMVSIALLAPDAATQAVWSDRTHDWAWPIQHLNAFAAYSGGLALTTLDFVRGLEFDAVILLDCSATAYPHTPAGARMLYTALTRARRQAYLLATDAPSEWLEVLERAVTRPQS